MNNLIFACLFLEKSVVILLHDNRRICFVFVSIDKIRFFYLGIHFKLESIINKWKNLKQQYKQHHDKQKRSWTERRKKSKLFDDMDQICGHTDTSSPACLIDSGLLDEGAGKVFLMSIWWGRAYMVYVNNRIMNSIIAKLSRLSDSISSFHIFISAYVPFNFSVQLNIAWTSVL